MKRNKKIMYGIFGVVAAIVAIFSLSMFVFKNENPNHNSSEQNEVFVEAVKNTTDGNVTIEIADTSFSGAGTLLRVEKHENVIVSNCTFDGATDSAIIVDGGKLSIGGNSVITNCAGANVICLESGTNSELKIENSTISNNSSGYVICASGIVGEVNVNDSIIKDNSGSVIFIDDFGGLGVRFGATSSTFENNGDTMFRFCDTTATFTDCVIDGKESSEEGISIESSVEKSQDYSSSYMSTLTLLGNTQIKNFTGLGVNATLTQLYFGTESQQFTGEISGNAGGGVLGLECYGSMNGGKISGNLGIGGIKLLDYECCYSFVDSTMSSYIETYFSFKDAEISNNTSTTNGGGIYCEGSLVLENTTVSQNEASTLGGGIFVTKDELRKSPVIVSIDESSVSGNKLTTTVEKAAFGGGLAFGSVTATIKDSFVSGNTSTYRGGGIYVGGATLDIVGTTVVCENSAEKEGSGLAASSGNVNLGTSNEVLSGGFAENSGGNTGAAINLSNATMNFNSGTIGAFGDYGGNSTTNGSGAVTVYTNSTFNMNGGLISGNTSAGGGAVTVSKSSTGRKSVFNFKAGTIKDNTNSNGNKNCGAVYVGDGCEFNMTSAGAVIENTSSTFGRAIYNLGTTNIINGIMKNCGLGAESSLYGGYIYNNGTLELSGGTIGEDSATANKHSYQGGAIFNAVNGSFSMSGGTIKNVSASNSGGAIYNVGTLSVTGGAIQGASAAANGGAIATTNKMGTFTGMNISGCSALRGGAIFVQGTEASPVEIVLGKNVKIRGNTAVNSGGGVYGKFAKINVAGATIESNTFTIERSDNASTTTNFGGAIDAEISEITIGSGVISNHVFEHSNVRGAAVSARNGTTFTMSGGTISGNITTHDNDQSWGGGLWSTGTYKKSNGSVVVGHVTITGGTFENNESYYGGAIRVLSNTSNTAEYATVTVTGGNFVGNIAHDYGAAFGVARVNMTFGGTANIDGNTM
ncbi:MAG: hypothetical protein IJW24_02775, partial [Clostridia bacterium]|nr:hypothetical protein [Clostridia bacterium]